MSIAVTCDNCGKRFGVNENFAGKRARCSDCGHTFRIPGSPGGGGGGSKGGSSVVEARDAAVGRVSAAHADLEALERIAAGSERESSAQELLDVWVPRMLTWIGFGGVVVGGIMTAHGVFEKHSWVGYGVMLLVGLMYWQLTLPWVVWAVRKAERQFYFQLPALSRRRLAVTFGVPTAFAYFFYAYGGVAPAVAGMFFGLFAAFFIMWGVLHLNLDHATTAFTCATILYLASIGVVVVVLFLVLKGLRLLLGPLTEAGALVYGG